MWTTRQATLADLPALRALCTAAVGPDDYVLGFLERFVRDSTTLIAVQGPRLAGMMVSDDTPDGSVWLHAARTHPDHRRQGVATALNEACAALARSRGRESLRLWADASNTASAAASRKDGFEERARFTRMRIDVRGSNVAPSTEPAALPRDWAAIESSRLLALGAGYVFYDFYFMPLTAPMAAWLSRAGALLRFGGNVICASEDFEDVRGKNLQIHLLAGDAGEILRAAPGIARARGADRVESFLPHEPGLLDVARSAGFEPMEWGQEAILFEKPLTLRAPRGPPTR